MIDRLDVNARVDELQNGLLPPSGPDAEGLSASDPLPAKESAPADDPAAEPGKLPAKERADPPAEGEKATSSEQWYNVLPSSIDLLEESAPLPEAKFYQESYPLYVPGAAYPAGDKKLSKPFFAIGMNSRLARFVDGHSDKGVLQLTDPFVGVPPVRDLLLREDSIMDPAAFDSEIAWERAARRELPRLERKLESERAILKKLVDLEAKGEQPPTKSAELEPSVGELARQVDALRTLLSQREAKREKKAEK